MRLKKLKQKLDNSYLLHNAEPEVEEYIVKLYQYSKLYVDRIIYRISGRRLPHHEDLKEDIATEILFTKSNKFDGRSSYHTWFDRTASRMIIDYLRKSSKEVSFFEDTPIAQREDILSLKINSNPYTTEDYDRFVSLAKTRNMGLVIKLLSEGFNFTIVGKLLGVSRQAIRQKFLRLVKAFKQGKHLN